MVSLLNIFELYNPSGVIWNKQNLPHTKARKRSCYETLQYYLHWAADRMQEARLSSIHFSIRRTTRMHHLCTVIAIQYRVQPRMPSNIGHFCFENLIKPCSILVSIAAAFAQGPQPNMDSWSTPLEICAALSEEFDAPKNKDVEPNSFIGWYWIRAAALCA